MRVLLLRGGMNCEVAQSLLSREIAEMVVLGRKDTACL